MLLGRTPPVDGPLLDAGVTKAKGQMRRFCLGTNQLSFPPGSVSISGATTPLPDELDAELGFGFECYARQPTGLAKEMARMDQAEETFSIRIKGLMGVEDDQGEERFEARRHPTPPGAAACPGDRPRC